MRDRHGFPLARGVPLSGDRLRSNPPPGPETPARPFSRGNWQSRIFMFAGAIAALLIANAAVRSIVGLSTPERSISTRQYEIPSFGELVECDAHFSNEIMHIKNNLPAYNQAANLPLLHRNYRRLHRLARQVGRRDGIPSAIQTERLRRRVQQLNQQNSTATAKARDTKCSAMAELPIARKRHSESIVGR